MFRKKQGVILEGADIYSPVLEIANTGYATLNSVSEPELEPEPVQSAMAVMERAKGIIVPFDNGTDLEKLDCEISRLSRESRTLLGIEAHAAAALNAKINELLREQRVAKAFEKFDSQKLRLSNEVLTWRKAESAHVADHTIPLPEVALFSLDQSIVQITSSWPRIGEVTPSLPPSLTQLYEDVWSSLNVGIRHTVRLIAAFSGVIPLETKTKIREAQKSKIFSDIRVLAEAEWAVDVVPAPFYADPIVVGLVEDEMWVIDIFDPTPLEDYIAREFTI